MKVGIVTITNGENYGNRLQNYATQNVLMNLGCDVETIFNNYGYKESNHIKKIIKDGDYNARRYKRNWA